MTDQTAVLKQLIQSDLVRMQALRAVRELALPDCWVAAGFVRNCVWDFLHSYSVPTPLSDIDVIYFDPSSTTDDHDYRIEARLRGYWPNLPWSVKNQARMHSRNGDEPYLSASEAMKHWPETATAAGVRLERNSDISVSAPFGLSDLFKLVVRPTPAFKGRMHIFHDRLSTKGWLEQWPQLRVES